MKICPACSREYAQEYERCRDDGASLVQLDTSSNERAQDLIGEVVDGRYRIERIVGRGGMGTVYACRHVIVGKQFAIKVLRSNIERSEEILQRFIREAQAANAVRSRHICEMTDFGQLGSGAFYVVMELLEGTSLTRSLRDEQLTTSALKHIFIQIAETLNKAHRANIVHRDLKPDNVVLINDEGDPHFVKLVDFGIAKMMESKASNLTETGVILGTPYYMSPEQARGDDIDHRSDIYSLGVMMYRAFTGRLPFIADTAMGVLTRHLTQKPELPSDIAPIEGGVESIILRCLEKVPSDRFNSMAELAAALREPLELATPSDQHPTLDERSRRRRMTPTRVAARKGSTADARSQVRPIDAPIPTPVPSSDVLIPPPVPRPAPPPSQGSLDLSRMAPRVNMTGAAPPPEPPLPYPNPVAAWPDGDAATQERPSQPRATAQPRAAASQPVFTTPQIGSIPGAIEQGEAHTHRGVVSSRMVFPQPPAKSRIGLWMALGAVATLLIGAGAWLLSTPRSVAPSPAAAPSARDVSTPEPHDDDSSSAEDDGGPTASPSASADPTTSATSSSAPLAVPQPPWPRPSQPLPKTTAPKTQPQPQPPAEPPPVSTATSKPTGSRPQPPPTTPPTQPKDDIRSPFDP